jgi:nucleotide-binding universal stress UspA family protein
MITLRNILVATDFGEPADVALLYAKNFGRAFGATVHVVHVAGDVGAQVVPPGVVVGLDQLQAELEAEARKRLDALREAEQNTVRIKTAVLVSSATASAIVGYARDEAIDLIVIGTHGRTGLAHFFLGSVAQHVVRAAPCPVLTVRHPEHDFAQPDALQVVERQSCRLA